ncbi:hypothetical protein COPEUT_00076 [Coprococcus eutactus ATCC 27759]|nr:hypothetical protein COPEUT_00076 [Coprococcus eutactus ATCC 27759]
MWTAQSASPGAPNDLTHTISAMSLPFFYLLVLADFFFTKTSSKTQKRPST